MPAATRTDNGAEEAEPIGEAEPTEEDGRLGVTDHLDMAVIAAQDQGMSASELMGLFFYYAHSIAEGFRQDVLSSDEGS